MDKKPIWKKDLKDASLPNYLNSLQNLLKISLKFETDKLLKAIKGCELFIKTKVEEANVIIKEKKKEEEEKKKNG